MRMTGSRAFTLLEVLVALAIFATVAAVVLTAVSRSLRNAEQLELKTLAGWIADNHLTELQLARPAAAEGDSQTRLSYAGRDWELRSQVQATGEPGLRRVTVWVARAEPGADAEIEARALASLTGILGEQP